MKVTLVDITSDPEALIAMSARTCYKSVAKSEGDNKKLVERLRDMGHLSTFEHAKATFRIEGISRACTHQLVRHRHFSFSQESQRYVNEAGFDYVTPSDISTNPELKEKFDQGMSDLNELYNYFISKDINKEDARFVLPNACTTTIVVSANFRALREFIKLRKTKEAQWEIREVAERILEILKKEAPAAFGDL